MIKNNKNKKGNKKSNDLMKKMHNITETRIKRKRTAAETILGQCIIPDSESFLYQDRPLKKKKLNNNKKTTINDVIEEPEVDYIKNIDDDSNSVIKKINLKLYYLEIKHKFDLWPCQDETIKFMENKENDEDCLSCYGGIVANDMGTGKTVIALEIILRDNKIAYEKTNKRYNGVTLIVVEKTILHNWVNEIYKFYPKNTFKFITLCEKQNMFLDKEYIEENYDIILTTYPTIISLFSYNKNLESKPKEHKYSCIYKIDFKRIIADEAHIFVSRDTMIFKAMEQLKGKNRWCFTGTPVRNNIGDLYSLLKFIKFPDNKIPTIIKQSNRILNKKNKNNNNNSNSDDNDNIDIINIDDNNKDNDNYKEGYNFMGFLNGISDIEYNEIIHFLKTITIRKLRNEVNPDNTDTKFNIEYETIIKRIEFSTIAEKILYNLYNTLCLSYWKNHKNNIPLSPTNKIKQQEEPSFNKVAVLIQIMRQLCLSPNIIKDIVIPDGILLCPSNILKYLKLSPNIRKDKKCDNIIKPEEYINTIKYTEFEKASFEYSKNSHIHCDDGTLIYWNPFEIKWNYDEYIKIYNNISNNNTTTNEFIDKDIKNHIQKRVLPLISTKNQAIVDFILNEIPDDDQCVLFCPLVAALEVLDIALKANNIKTLMMDGRDSMKLRTSKLSKFSEKDSNIKVFLLSTKIACVGLNLTSANWVLIASPWWTPFVEDQFIARTVRFGQTKRVKVVYFIISSTIEEYVLEVSSRKKTLTKVFSETEKTTISVINKMLEKREKLLNNPIHNNDLYFNIHNVNLIEMFYYFDNFI